MSTHTNDCRSGMGGGGGEGGERRQAILQKAFRRPSVLVGGLLGRCHTETAAQNYPSQLLSPTHLLSRQGRLETSGLVQKPEKEQIQIVISHACLLNSHFLFVLIVIPC